MRYLIPAPCGLNDWRWASSYQALLMIRHAPLKNCHCDTSPSENPPHKSSTSLLTSSLALSLSTSPTPVPPLFFPPTSSPSQNSTSPSPLILPLFTSSPLSRIKLSMVTLVSEKIFKWSEMTCRFLQSGQVIKTVPLW